MLTLVYHAGPHAQQAPGGGIEDGLQLHQVQLQDSERSQLQGSRLRTQSPRQRWRQKCQRSIQRNPDMNQARESVHCMNVTFKATPLHWKSVSGDH